MACHDRMACRGALQYTQAKRCRAVTRTGEDFYAGCRGTVPRPQWYSGKCSSYAHSGKPYRRPPAVRAVTTWCNAGRGTFAWQACHDPCLRRVGW